MLIETLSYLKCPNCAAELACATDQVEVLLGIVSCNGCKARFPVLAGVLILVRDVRGYLLEHVKGISRQVNDDEIPKEHRTAYVKAKRQIAVEHIEEDLEAERVTALYVMNHYLRASEVCSPSPALDGVIQTYWDHGPFAKIKERLARDGRSGSHRSLIELGCGVGGLCAALRDHLETYLGLDSSFASIALARHLVLGAPLRGRLLVPDDLLHGPVSRQIKVPPSKSPSVAIADFIVCELDHPPVKTGVWDLCAALNVMDMLPEPRALPALQYELLSRGGTAIQSCPYIWHQVVAGGLRKVLPKEVKDSASAVEWLYRQRGFNMDSVDLHVPWVFFKHVRQIELYSVHLFFASKASI
ncbi:class I SAM-dependent methyltransferase [Bdellovibrionota bacterium FG-1]